MAVSPLKIDRNRGIQETQAAVKPIINIHLPVTKPKPPQNHFYKGWCTYYVASKRYVPWFGNAGQWARNARRMRFLTGKTPKVGAIYVSRKESSRGSNMGHVAYVEKVLAGSFLVSEMNYVGFNKISYRWISTSNIIHKGVEFVY